MNAGGNPSLAYSNIYAFELLYGGIGIALSCSINPSAPQAIPECNGSTISVHNDGEQTLWFALGDEHISATTACTPVGPGTKEVFTVPKKGTFTHISTITRSGSTTGTLNFGFGT